MARQTRWAALAGFAILFSILPRKALGQYGIWTSEDRHVSQSDTTVPTFLGKQLGDVTYVGPFSVVNSAPDFGDWLKLVGSVQHHTWFTENSLTSSFTQTYFSYGPGNLSYFGANYLEHIEAQFHLGLDTPYLFEGQFGSVSPPSLPAGHYPTLTGPGGQVITLSGTQSGLLAAGDWRFLLEFQAIYPEDDSSAVNNIKTASFQFVVPEPGTTGIAAAFLVLGMRRRRHSGCA
jgi:hypothetical protein